MIRIPESDSLADLRLTAFDVIFRLGDRLVEFWKSMDADLIERARLNRIDVAAARSQRSGWRHPNDPGYLLKEPGLYKSLLQLPPLGQDTTKMLKGAMTSIGDQRDRWAHQTPELIGHPGPHGHLVELTRDAVFVSETLGFDELVGPLHRLRSALDGGLRDVPPAPTRSAKPTPPPSFRIGAPTEVPLGSRTVGLMGGRIWGDDGRPLVLPEEERRTDADLARVWSRIIGLRDAKLWIAPDGRAIVEHRRQHWVIDIIGEAGPRLDLGAPLTGWVVDRVHPLLDTDGSIWDYVSGKTYFEAGSDVGSRLLSRHLDGGPLQITAEGAVGARDDDSGENLVIGSLEDPELDIFLN